jgi:hypothetical protein
MLKTKFLVLKHWTGLMFMIMNNLILGLDLTFYYYEPL